MTNLKATPIYIINFNAMTDSEHVETIQPMNMCVSINPY